MQEKLVRLFVHSAAVVLLVTASAKTVSALGDARILDGPDPIFGTDIRSVFLFAATIEGVVACVCLRQAQLSLQIKLLFWLSTMFGLYRVGLRIVGYDQACRCLGTITDALGISPNATDLGMRLVLSYLFIGSSAAWFWFRQHRDPHDHMTRQPGL